ncbi:hypothetical protein LWI28_025404 [Acer negundo]|uniref:Uncharacterized protein n=1 Tax=Acer negundo TaxID=4023 RepID=A0AAD5J309_ACENE|nr:hypothetical protein LWI28_025404 [Acer negundo]
MKGGNYYRLSGRLHLITVLFTTILLWACEKNKFVTTLLSGQDQFTWPSSGLLKVLVRVWYTSNPVTMYFLYSPRSARSVDTASQRRVTCMTF